MTVRHRLVDVGGPSYRSLVVKGDLDQSSADKLILAFAEVIQTGSRTVIVDLNKVKYLNEHGVGALVRGRRVFEEKGGKFVIACSSDRNRKVLSDCMPDGQEPFRVTCSSKAAVEAFEQEIEDKIQTAQAKAATTA